VGNVFSKVETCIFDVFKEQDIRHSVGNFTGEFYTQVIQTNSQGFLETKSFVLIGNLCNPYWYPSSSTALDKICTRPSLPLTDMYIRTPLGLLKLSLDQLIDHLTSIVPLRTKIRKILSSTWIIG
jgi:hypothetical protein